MRGDQSWRERQTWTLGRWSKPLGWLAVIWIVLFSPVFLYPFALNPASLLIVAAFMGLLVIYYLVWARSRFRGPMARGTEAQLSEIEKEFEHAAEGLVGA
jgi:hypothetical protein